MPIAAGDAASGQHHPEDRFQWDFVTPGIPDGAFANAPGFSPTPMELRVMLLAHLRPQPDSLVWDVGGGTGALALEIARLLPRGAVLALERDPDALDLLARNRQHFQVNNLKIIPGRAPDDLGQLDGEPDRVLLEVSRPDQAILDAVWPCLRPHGRLVISTSNLAGLVDATNALRRLQAADLQVVQATVHRLQQRGPDVRLAAAEPLFLIAAERPGIR